LYFSFYRFVLEPEVIFDKSGHLSPDPIAKFSNMPTSPLLTQILHVPDNWLVESVASPYDLDNIRLEDVEMGVYRYVHILFFLFLLIKSIQIRKLLLVHCDE